MHWNSENSFGCHHHLEINQILSLNNPLGFDMPLNKETKPN